MPPYRKEEKSDLFHETTGQVSSLLNSRIMPSFRLTNP